MTGRNKSVETTLEEAIFFRVMFQDILQEYSYDDVPDEFKIDFNGVRVPVVQPKKKYSISSLTAVDAVAPVKTKYTSDYNRWRKIRGISNFMDLVFDHPLMWHGIRAVVNFESYDGVLMTYRWLCAI
jgi:hypothetical protein